MSEEEIIKYLENSLNDEFNFKNCTRVQDKMAIKGLLDLYQKEKEKNEKLNKYITDKVKTGKEIQTFINKGYVEQEYVSKDKIKKKIEDKIICCRAEELDDCYIGDKHSQYWSMFRKLLEKLLQDLLEERN